MYKSIIRILDRIGEYLNEKNSYPFDDDPYGGAWPGSVTFKEDTTICSSCKDKLLEKSNEDSN